MKKKKDSYPDLLEIEYRLAELPSAQHRAGLVGLVLMAGWIKQEYVCRGICDIEMSERGVMLYLDQLGLAELFNGLYAASREEQERLQPMRNQRTREIIPPLREEVREEAGEEPDPRRGEGRRTKIYVYESIVPQGAFLAELDPSGDEERGLWIRLWREVVWSILRSVPATRKPYEARANDERVIDYEMVWNDLCRGWEHSVQLPGTYFLGAQSLTAEKLPFRDRARYQFLLNFWPLVAQIYVPVVYDSANNLNLRGFVIAIPDVSSVDHFCRLFSSMLLARSTEVFRPRPFRPAGAIVDLVEEAGLDLLRRLREQARRDQPPVAVDQILDGVELFHLEREGNSVRQIHFSRVEPDEELLDRYCWVRSTFLNPLLRRQQLVNLLTGRGGSGAWTAGYDQLLARLPVSQTFMNGPFRRDVAAIFANNRAARGPQMVEEAARVAGLVHLAVASALRRELGESPPRQSLVRRARTNFLAIRERHGQDFIDYFLAWMRSSGPAEPGPDPQGAQAVGLAGAGPPAPVDPARGDARLQHDNLEDLTRERPDEIRVLTLLALIALAAGSSSEEHGTDVP